MHLDPIYIAFTAVFLLLLIVLPLVMRIRHRVLAGRELIYLLGQYHFEYILIDIRRNQDFIKGHIPNALNVPYPDCLNYLPTENMFEKIYIYGNTRRQARNTAKTLGITGYFNVSYFGAFRSWRGPVVKEQL